MVILTLALVIRISRSGLRVMMTEDVIPLDVNTSGKKLTDVGTQEWGSSVVASRRQDADDD